VLAGRADQPRDFLGLQSAARDGGGLARIRERLRAGDYDSPAIIDEVARRIVISGDL
jgi:hypothetical protein